MKTLHIVYDLVITGFCRRYSNLKNRFDAYKLKNEFVEKLDNVEIDDRLISLEPTTVLLHNRRGCILLGLTLYSVLT